MKSSFEKKSLAFAIIVLFFGMSIIPSMVAERPVLIETIYIDNDNTKGPWDGTEKHSLDYENDDYHKEIELKGECYDFFETHHLGQLNHIGPFWFSSPSSVMTLRFREDFEMIVDGEVQDLEPPITIFIFRFSGFCPPPWYHEYIVEDDIISLSGFCEEYYVVPHVIEDNILDSRLFNVSDFVDLGQIAWGVTHNDFNDDGLVDFAVTASDSPETNM